MSRNRQSGRSIRIDSEAQSASPTEPAFIARPAGAPIYYGFPILESSQTDGWRLGVISEPNNPDGCDSLDGFVVAPDGSRAGLVWDVGVTDVEQILEPDEKRWGVYSLPLSQPVHDEFELIDEFRKVLPTLIRLKAVADDA